MIAQLHSYCRRDRGSCAPFREAPGRLFDEFVSIDHFLWAPIQLISRGGYCTTPVCQQRARVLIVHDDPATIGLLEEFLRGTATSFRSVSDSRQVEIAFEEFAPDIVLLNLQMPCINQVVQRVSNLLQTRELFVELAAGYMALERDQQNQATT